MPITRQPQHAHSPLNGSSLVTRNLRLERGRTSIRLEQLEWTALDLICAAEGLDRHTFATLIDRDPARREKTLTSRIRSAVLGYFILRSGLRPEGAGSALLPRMPLGNRDTAVFSPNGAAEAKDAELKDAELKESAG
ncbi:MAG TPA: ribbon-helix-helix domain-containing protein [Ferrovibrio sp.]|jgi:predicted DNA-binding ribbon-helix-helix protein|uniref:ribbon-helix-helix domain-containing protein n=1 Tax=Ferrovibrio sp. TaxID=1917215 RepID=UPI002ED60002